ncbi:undecaprenyldiphospho-muramoylpentapeptide beta-N-acetylglucosaminyltransferase [Parasediminibacterium paludis]|uniref:UDP-N-acetylglucosamine--N-acetylmuramyl-(pentapeptide) pyrophosphoryl-undecaprenol N-acetylglucosamine transferase n=1 Tax=Parasediminibacterium paludis TaxID=908966 RepID=A0ABV8PWS6_9BACT
MSVLNENIKKSHSTPLGAGRRIIIAGGGTGGHIFPAIAIANAIKQLQPDADILFVGAKGKMEMEKVPQAGYPIKGLTIAGFNRSSLIKNIGLPPKIIKSFFQVRAIIKQFKPTAVIGVGGYSSFPVLRVAQSKGIPTFIHESNSFAGKANMLLGKKATKIFVATDGMGQFFPAEKIVVTGNPVRASIAHSKVTQAEALSFFGLQSNIKTVLVVGGSLGAKSINDAIANHIETFAEQGLQLIWQTGKTNAAHYKAIAIGKANVWVSDFITQMDMGYAAADIVISRAGAMAVTELCVAGKPSIFVPYPFASEDHQTANAMALVNKKAGLLVKDSDVNEALINTVLELSNNELSQQVLQQNISALAIKNADEIIAQQILSSI